MEFINYIWVDKNALLTKLAFREVRAFLFRMHIWALFIRVLAVRPVSASDPLFVFKVCAFLLLVSAPRPNVVPVLIQINDRITTSIHLYFFLIALASSNSSNVRMNPLDSLTNIITQPFSLYKSV